MLCEGLEREQIVVDMNSGDQSALFGRCGLWFLFDGRRFSPEPPEHA